MLRRPIESTEDPSTYRLTTRFSHPRASYSFRLP